MIQLLLTDQLRNIIELVGVILGQYCCTCIYLRSLVVIY